MRYLVTALRHPRDYQWAALRPWQRHSLVLAAGGGVYVLYGLSYFLIPLTTERASGISLALSVGPIHAWATIWIVVGLLALASTRWPPASKTWGYSAMTGLAAWWGSVYLLSIPLGGPRTGLTGTLVWWLVGFLWWGISGLTNPDDVPRTALHQPGDSTHTQEV